MQTYTYRTMHKLPKLVLSDAHSTQFAAHDKVSTQRSFHGDSAKHETQNSLQNCLRTYYGTTAILNQIRLTQTN